MTRAQRIAVRVYQYRTWHRMKVVWVDASNPTPIDEQPGRVIFTDWMARQLPLRMFRSARWFRDIRESARSSS